MADGSVFLSLDASVTDDRANAEGRRHRYNPWLASGLHDIFEWGIAVVMSLDKAMIVRVARLARIQIAPEEEESLAQDLSHIIGWVEQLERVDTDAVEPIASVSDLRLVMREDQVHDGGDAGVLLANAPQAQAGFFVVPKVVE